MEQTSLALHDMLFQARQQKAWSVDEVAQRLKLPGCTIKALESGHYAQLHGDAYVLAYLRCYGQLLELDTALLCDLYRRLNSHQRQTLAFRPNGLVPANSAKAQHKQYKTAYGLAIVLALVALLAFFAPQKTPLSAEPEAPIPTAVAEAAPLDRIQAEPMIEEVVAEPAKTPEHVPQLQFAFSADCWVRVVDGTQQEIFADIQKANQSLQLTGVPPFYVTLGYAPGVELRYNGEPVDIGNTSANNTAKLVLGSKHS